MTQVVSSKASGGDRTQTKRRWSSAVMALSDGTKPVLVDFGGGMLRPLDKKSFLHHITRVRRRLKTEDTPGWFPFVYKRVLMRLSFGKPLDYRYTRAIRQLAEAPDMMAVPSPFPETECTREVDGYRASGHGSKSARAVHRIVVISDARRAHNDASAETKAAIKEEAAVRREALGIDPERVSGASQSYRDLARRRVSGKELG